MDNNRHNEDIAACAYDACPLRLQCLRWQLGTNKDPYQAWLDGSTCGGKYFIDNKDYKS